MEQSRVFRPDGKFAPGNKAYLRKLVYKKAFRECVTQEQVQTLVDELYSLALQNENIEYKYLAIMSILDRCFGKAKASIETTTTQNLNLNFAALSDDELQVYEQLTRKIETKVKDAKADIDDLDIPESELEDADA